MVRSITADELEAKLIALLDEVEGGEQISIIKGGRLVARLLRRVTRTR